MPKITLSTRVIQWSVTLIGLGAVVGFILSYPPAFEIAWDAAKIFFSLLSTPFILEGFFTILGFIIVISLNNRRLAKETADEWVYLEEVNPVKVETAIEDRPTENSAH